MPIEQKLQSYLQENLPAYLDLLRRMVEINSFTGNPAGVKAVAALTATTFAELGFSAELIPATNPEYGDHLVLSRPGTAGRIIGLISHLDTVFPPEEEQRHNFVWREAEGRIYGPGIVDIKGGTVGIYMVLAALRQFAPAQFEQTTWLVLLDALEERGGFDFGELCRQRLAEAQAALVFEPGPLSDNGFKIVTARKGMAVYRVTVEGRAAHAGNDHPHGANAIVQLAETVRRIAALTDYERNLTFNVGVISGGSGTNRVPHQAEALVEMRAFDLAVFEEGIAAMLALSGPGPVRSAAGDYPCRVTVELTYQVPPWPSNPATERLLQSWQAAAQTLGVEVVRQERGGLSDGNLFWQQVPTLDGLGPAGGNMHCSERSDDGSKEQEYVERDSLVPKAVLNTLAILHLLEQD